MPYQLTPMPPRRDNQDFLTSFMSTFLPAAQQMLMYKYQKSMEEDSWMKRQRMEQAWKLEELTKKAELDAKDPRKAAEYEKTLLEIEQLRKKNSEPPKFDFETEVLGPYFRGTGSQAGQLGGTQTPAPMAQAIRNRVASTVGKEAAEGFVPKSEPELQAEVDKQDRWRNMIGDTRRRSIMSGALTSPDAEVNDWLDKGPNKKFQSNMEALRPMGVGLTGPGTMAMADYAMGNAGEPTQVGTRKEIWERDKKARTEAEKKAQEEADLARKSKVVQKVLSGGKQTAEELAEYGEFNFGKEDGTDKPMKEFINTSGENIRDAVAFMPTIKDKQGKELVPWKENMRSMFDINAPKFVLNKEEWDLLKPEAKAYVKDQINAQALRYVKRMIDHKIPQDVAEYEGEKYLKDIIFSMGFPPEDILYQR